MIQGGDPTATGEGGESVYGRPFKDEFHSRLRFTHRGIVACANQNNPDTNGSQFFITLDKCEDLNKRYTIFGRVVGDTIHNVTRIGEVLTDKESRPLDPIVLTKTEVVWNPFDDIVLRAPKSEAVPDASDAEKGAKSGRKGKKDFKLLSFGDEAEEDEVELASAEVPKLKSAHDALESDGTLVTAASEKKELTAEEKAKLQSDLKHVRTILDKDNASLSSHKADAENSDHKGNTDGEKMSLEDKMQIRVAEMRRKETQKKKDIQEAAPESPENVVVDAQETDIMEVDNRTFTTTTTHLHLKRTPLRDEEVKDADLLTNSQIQRAKYKRRKQLHGDRENSTLAKLLKFKSSLSTSKQPSTAAPEGPSTPADGIEDEAQAKADERMDVPAAWRIDDYLKDGEDVGLTDLTGHRLEFKGNEKKDEMSRRDDVDDYVVFDPLLEAGKSKFNKKQQEAKRKNREWTITKTKG